MANQIKIGSLEIDAFKVGSADCKVYLGNTLLYPTTFQGKWKATYQGGRTSSAQCDASSAITRNEVDETGVVLFEIGNCVTSIGNNAFYYCTSLTSITISDSVTSIGESAFSNCTSLTSITLPDSVTYIDGFDDCSGLTSVTIGSGITSVGFTAFKNCTNLPVENNIRYADTIALETLDKTLTTYTLKSDTRCLKYSIFRYCENLTSIDIPSGVTSIGGDAFYGCINLTRVNSNTDGVCNIPDNVTIIDGQVFAGCSGFTSVTIGSGITSIGSNVFPFYNGLTGITIKAPTPPTITRYTFNSAKNYPIYVPAASVDAYKAADVWSTYYASRIQAIP